MCADIAMICYHAYAACIDEKPVTITFVNNCGIAGYNLYTGMVGRTPHRYGNIMKVFDS